MRLLIPYSLVLVGSFMVGLSIKTEFSMLILGVLVWLMGVTIVAVRCWCEKCTNTKQN